MKNLKRYWYVALAAVLAVAAAFFLFPREKGAKAVENLLRNGDFAQTDEDKNPVGWYLDAYAGLTGSLFEVIQEDGQNVAHIINIDAKDARYAQNVAVEPSTFYCLHGYIRADAQGGRGANLSIEGVYVFSEEVYDSQGQWREITLYGKTGESQKDVTVFARLGGYSGEATGEAYFKDISLTKVNAVPAGYAALSWDRAAAASNTPQSAEGTASMKLILLSAAYALLCVFLMRFLRKDKSLENGGFLSSPYLAAGLLLLSLLIRLLVAYRVPGYDVDIGCFTAWGATITNVGPANFYSAVSFCDYPPGYMWILWLLGGVGRLLGTGITEFMVKLPPILADMGLCAILYVEAKKQGLSGPAALALSLMYALNPLIIASGAAWGQSDALMTLLMALVVIFALRGAWKAAMPCYMAAVLTKPQALMFGPLGLVALVVYLTICWKDKEKKSAALRDVGLGLLLTLLTAMAIVLPFSIHQSPTWLFTLYANTMGGYAYSTVNGCNLYFLLGKNWVSSGVNAVGFWYVPLAAYALVTLPLLWAPKSPRFKGGLGGKIRLYVLCGLAGALAVALLLLLSLGALTFAALSTALIVYCVAVVSFLFIYAEDLNNLPVFGAILLLMLFNTGGMMHERYLFPAVALLLLGYMKKRDSRVLWLAIGVTVAGFLNVGCVLDRNIRIGGAAGHLDAPSISSPIVSDTSPLEYLSAAMNTALCFVSVALCASIARGEGVTAVSEDRAEIPLPKEESLRKMTGKDWLILSAVTVLYAVLTFTNLGSLKAPQNAFVSQSAQDEALLDLGEAQNFYMLYYGGIHQNDSDFTVEVSVDQERWHQVFTAGMKIGDCFKWKYLSSTPTGTYPVELMGRYVRIRADHYALNLGEVIFRDAQTKETLPVTLLSDIGQALIDEQDTLEGEPGWYNSTYFDEIYHARTGYELLHHMEIYEWTHPPLGKVFISFAIGIFGMTPFGWRFAGALAGVLMLPAMYLMGKLLTKKRWGGLGASALLALDLMHFTQTRIATIDSFVVLFIIWMVYFMLRWFFQDFFAKPLWKTMIPLALSGLLMGFAVASKWTGCYAGVALALIFFFGIFRRYRLVRAAKAIPEKQRSEMEREAADRGVSSLLITIASCFIFFVAVPLLVYYCSYIPFFAHGGMRVSVQGIVNEAQRMLTYHSKPGLGMDHFFYSPWYQWPVIGKPMWYSSNSFEPEGYHMTIMAMGNPAVWWTGLVAVLALACLWVKRHLHRDGIFALGTEKNDSRAALVLICYFIQLLPWILVPRGTYIYHYFPCVPFLILAIMLCLDEIACAGDEEGADAALAKRSGKTAGILLSVLLAVSAILFIAFFPYASGIQASTEWLDSMKWFNNWLWY